MLAKKELSYVPIIGWMWYFLEIVFCKRKWEEDRRTVAESLQNLHDYPENFWVRFSSSSMFVLAPFYLLIISLFPGGSFCFSVKAHASHQRSTRSACRWRRAKAYPN